MKLRSMYAFCLAGALASTASSALAQATKVEPLQGGPMIWMQDDGVQHGIAGRAMFMGADMAFDAKTVTGAPYSAESVTESVQSLSDGNRIVHTNRAVIYRDSEGRTRREQTFEAIGPWAKTDGPSKIVMIHDPVAGVHYVMNVDDKSARKMPAAFVKVVKTNGVGEGKGEGKGTGVGVNSKNGQTVVVTVDSDSANNDGKKVLRKKVVVDGQTLTEDEIGADTEVFAVAAPPPGAGMMGGAGVGQMMRFDVVDDKDAKKESLGKKSIEGVECEGTRSTITIPVGQIGNERAIEITSERWYSPELQTVVMTKRSDPRYGETTYQLTNIRRSEPDKSLFEVPSDYTVEDGFGPMMRMKQRKS